MRSFLSIHARNPGSMTGSGNHTYLMIDAGRGALIDAGVGDPGHVADIRLELEHAAATLGSILVTHGHPDHASGAPGLADAFPAARFRKFPWLDEDRRFGVSWEPLADGDQVTVGAEHLTVVYTPGHSPDHLSFWHEPTRTLFSGDLIVEGSSVMIHASGGGSLIQYLASLRRVLSLNPLRLLPAHGPEIREPERTIKRYLSHRQMREEQVIRSLGAGRRTVRAIVDSIYDDLAPALVPAAEENVRAHLEKLRLDGSAVEHRDGWNLRARE